MEARVADALSRAKAAGKLADGVEPSSAAGISSVSSRGCEWSVKRHRHGSRRKPPLTLFSTASLGRQPMDASLLARLYLDQTVLKGRMRCLPSRSSVRWPSPCSGVISSWPSKWALGVSASLLPRAALLAIAFCLFRSSKGPRVNSSAYRSYFGFPWWAKLRAVLCWPWARLRKHVGRRISTRHALYRLVSLADARRETVSHTSTGVLLAFVGVVVLAAGPGLSANTLPLLLVVGAAFAFAVSNILTKRYGPFDPLM